MPNGVLEKQYEVHCDVCEAPLLGIGSTVSQAVSELTFHGWAKPKGLGGRWHCPRCLSKYGYATKNQKEPTR